MSKKVFIFDMDGVLLKPRGYHQALKDTVRLGAQALGFDLTISDEEIAQFEGLGISSEWHSSAACMAMLVVNGKLDLRPLFAFLKGEQAQSPARIRLERAIQKMAEDVGVNPARAVSFIQESESPQSFTNSTFQKMILGSADSESYLLKCDEPLLGADVRKELFAWLQHSEHGSVVMTNRPSRTEPDASYGKKLVGIEEMPLVGYGEMWWLAKKFGGEAAGYSKPSPIHALTATLTAFGRDLDKSLLDAFAASNGGGAEEIACLEGSEIWVFEDSPAGMISVGAMGKLLRGKGLNVKVNKIGVSTSPFKGKYLEAQGARVFESIDAALGEIL